VLQGADICWRNKETIFIECSVSVFVWSVRSGKSLSHLPSVRGEGCRNHDIIVTKSTNYYTISYLLLYFMIIHFCVWIFMGCYEHGTEVPTDVNGWKFVGYRNKCQLQMIPMVVVSQCIVFFPLVPTAAIFLEL
jgi:hypothetical protein